MDEGGEVDLTFGFVEDSREAASRTAKRAQAVPVGAI
jgi:hypothetical protein